MTVPDRPLDGDRESADVRAGVPHPARIYDYWLGGKDNFAADRREAARALKRVPEFADYAIANRRFLGRAVRFLSAAGIGQFLDLGAGLPASPNVHEIAQSADPDARVLSVDNDPMVYVHAQAVMGKSPQTAAVRADLRAPDEVLRAAGAVLDFRRPVALMFVACLHHLTDDDDPAGVVARYAAAVAPGSFLVLSHQTGEFAPERMQAASAEAGRIGFTFVPRSRERILAMFGGRNLVEPGLVLVPYWRPDGEPGPNASRAWAYGAVAPLLPEPQQYLRPSSPAPATGLPHDQDQDLLFRTGQASRLGQPDSRISVSRPATLLRTAVGMLA
jgi:SAM-dependent methyltransferase